MYRVLCVEDEVSFREDVADFLRMKTFEVDEADNGREALTKLAQHDYDIILSDIKMPDVDGFNMFRQLPEGAPPVIFMSALNDHETLVESHTLGCEDFITKPVNFKVLLAALEHRIRARAKLREAAAGRENDIGDMLINCIQHVLSKPLLQISEAAYYLTSLPEDAPLAKSRPILEMVKDAANTHLEEMGLLKAGLELPAILPESARPIHMHGEFLHFISHNVPTAQTSLGAPTGQSPVLIEAQPDWIIRGFTELLRTHNRPLRPDGKHTPALRFADANDHAVLTYADGIDMADDDLGYMQPEAVMQSAAACEGIASRMLAILYLQAVAQAHQGYLLVKYDHKYRLAVRMHIPRLRTH